MTSVKVKFSPSSVILKEGTVHYQIIHHCKVRHIRTGYKLFPSEWISASGEINVSAGSGEGRKSYLAALKIKLIKTFPNKEMHQPIESGRQPFHCGPYNRTLHCS